MGNAHPNIVPYQVFPVADGHVIIAVGNDGQFAKFVRVIGHPELAQDERFRTNTDRVRNRAGPRAAPHRDPGGAPARRAPRGAGAGAVPAGPINTVADVFADPQVIARGLRLDLDAPAAQGGTIPTVRSPILLDGAPLVADRPSPALGQHTDEVLGDPAWTGSAA
jgi:crotonobetainyl-CoA:carnitine CoA-transferase CaiB-like acyl-CoA transferase